jgi:thiol-disulfide isomerase/thioredoxin
MKWNHMKHSIILIFFVCLIGCVICTEKAEGLYSPTSSVFILNQNNFHHNVLRSDSGWIVEFYNSWCGHCIKFAPTWKEFAKKHEGLFLIIYEIDLNFNTSFGMANFDFLSVWIFG